MSKKTIIPVLLLCLLLSACGQMDIEHGQDAMNATTAAPTVNTTTIPTAATTTGSNNTVNKPPSTFSINDEQKLALMRNAATDDAALEQFLAEDNSPLMRNRADVLAFLEVLETIPVLTVENAKTFSMTYTPSKALLEIAYRIEEGENHWYRFTYILDKDRNESVKDSILQEAGTREFSKIGKERNINLLQILDMSKTQFAKSMAEYRVEMDGMVVLVTYKNIHTDVSVQNVEDVFAFVTAGETIEVENF